MSVNRLYKGLALFLAALAVSLGGYVTFVPYAFGQESLAQSAPEKEEKILKFDVAEDFTRLSVDETPVFEEDGLPAYGNPFITQGYIYPAGTLTCNENGCNGVLEDGSPEFPDKVMGQWTCWGYHIGDGAHTQTGPVVITTQLYNFGDEFTNDTIVTEGYELIDLDTPFKRAITGGTGSYAEAEGEATQTLLGFNQINGATLRYELKFKTKAK